MAFAIDTLAYARRLREAGFSEQQAEGQARVRTILAIAFAVFFFAVQVVLPALLMAVLVAAGGRRR